MEARWVDGQRESRAVLRIGAGIDSCREERALVVGEECFVLAFDSVSNLADVEAGRVQWEDDVRVGAEVLDDGYLDVDPWEGRVGEGGVLA